MLITLLIISQQEVNLQFQYLDFTVQLHTLRNTEKIVLIDKGNRDTQNIPNELGVKSQRNIEVKSFTADMA